MSKELVFSRNRKHSGFEVVKESLLFMQICTTETDKEKIEQMVQDQSPSGISSNWHLSDEPGHAPVACDNGGGNFHYMLSC